MKRDDYSLVSEADGARISLTEISADEPRFLLQIVHGMAEHRGRYVHFMEYLASRGGAVIAQDLRGHGESAGKENYGYFGEDAVRSTLADVLQAGEELRRKYPERPFILFGHSMGTLIARMICAEHDELLDGLVLSGAVSYNPLVGCGLALAHVCEFFRGGRHRSPLISQLAMGSFDLAFPPADGPGGKHQWLSENPANRIAYEADGACGFDFTLNGHIALFTFMREAYAPKNWNVRRPELPVLFLSGENDPVMTDRRHFEDAVRFMRDMGYRDTAVQLLPGMRHEILNETERQSVYEMIGAFVDGKCMKNFPTV